MKGNAWGAPSQLAAVIRSTDDILNLHKERVKEMKKKPHCILNFN
jgi:hypothetical protein